MKTLHGFCTENNLSKTSVRRWLLDNGFDTSNGLSKQAIDAALERFVPLNPVVTEDVQSEVMETSIVRTESRANPMIPINIQSLTINIQSTDTRQLANETAQFQQVGAQGLKAIGELMQADLYSAVRETMTQNRHAVAGLNAAATVGLANELGKRSGESAA